MIAAWHGKPSKRPAASSAPSSSRLEGQRRQRSQRTGSRAREPGDGRKYWAMTTDITDCTVLNRMKIEDDLERLRREGQAMAVEEPAYP